MKNYILLTAAALMLGACSNDENLDNPNGPVELRLTSGLEVQTRAAHGLNTQLKNGEEVHVWVDDATTDQNLYTNNILAAGDQGALTGGITMYFPETGNNVDIYAIHGNWGSTALTGFWGTEQTHSVAQDQRTEQTTDGYAKSDLVYAKSQDVKRGQNPTTVNLTFTHLLSKVEVVLVPGAGPPIINKVEILNTKLDAKFTPNRESEITATADGTIDGTTLNAIEIDKDLTSSKNAAGDDESKKNLNEAVIVPQTLAKGTPFIRVTTNEGGELIYRLKEETTFALATKYRYTITANLTGLEVTATITPWDQKTGDDNGTAEMQ